MAVRVYLMLVLVMAYVIRYEFDGDIDRMMASDGSDGSDGLIGVSALLPASLNLNLDLEQDGCDHHHYHCSDHHDHYDYIIMIIMIIS